MQPTNTQPTAPASNTPFNNGAPLTTQQIQNMRQQMNISPTEGNSSAGSSNVSSQWAKYDGAQSTQNSQPSTIPEDQQPGSMSKAFGNTFQQGGQDIMGDISAMGNTTETGTTGQKILGAVADVGKTAGNIAGSIAGTAGGLIGDVIAPFLPDSVKGKLGDVATTINQKVSQIPGMTPEIQKSLGDLFNTVTLMGGAEAEPAVTSALAKGADVATEGINNAVENIGNAADKVKGVVSDTASKLNPLADNSTDLEKIKDTITPKMTPKEAKLAETQGRLIKGQPATMFKSGTADQIATSDAQLKQVNTISRLIGSKEAASMDEPTLYSALDDKITETAKNLQPEMEKVGVNPATVEKITNDWEALKKSETENADASDEKNVAKTQAQFEKRLQTSGNKNMNDLWNTAKEYDKSVPENVKKANSLSSESLQTKKALWLGRRAILKNAINDTSNGLGKTSKSSFSDMSDMYEAQKGILSKAKVDTVPEASKLSQAYNSKPGKIIRGVAKAGLGIEGAKEILKL
jgi:hypothetical protein